LDLVARYFVARSRRPLADFPPGRLVVGQFGPGSAAGGTPVPPEEVVLNRHSDSAIELHCHGGLAAVARIEEMLVSGGCRRVSWQEWTANQEADPFAAAARLALAEARTTRSAAILLDQYRGALRGAMEQIEASLQAGANQAARQQIEALLAHAATGSHLTRPWRVVLAGRPNVGKSSLINAIAGYQRAIVHSTPGTTRDVVSLETAIDGWPVEISDTAGLREPGEEIERAGLDLARQKILAADLVVLVFDNSLPWSEQDQALVESYPTALRVYNKSDLPRAPSCGWQPPGLELSAMYSAGIDALCHEIAGRLVPHPPPPGAAVPFEPEQIEQIHGYFGP
jgi:tRNA modification GTPase